MAIAEERPGKHLADQQWSKLRDSAERPKKPTTTPSKDFIDRHAVAVGSVLLGALLAAVVFGLVVLLGDDTTASSPTPTPVPREQSPQANTSSTSAQDVLACTSFREHFVYSDWGLLTSEEIAAIGIGSYQAREVVFYASPASRKIAAAAEGLSSTSQAAFATAIDDMLLACASVVTR